MGGAAGHMSHPFDLPTVGNGSDLIKFFEESAELLTANPGSVKIDGVNVSFKLIDGPQGKEFAVDRGSLKPIDIEGITIDRIGERFPEGHGMRTALSDLLLIFNKALPSIESELKALGLYDNPTVFFNTEYVKGTTNVLQYDEDFLAIHGVNQFYEKQSKIRGKGVRPGLPRPINPKTDKPIKDPSKEIPYDRSVLASVIEKVAPIAEKQGFKIFGDVPTEKVGDISFDSTLASDFTVVFNEEDQVTKSLRQWLVAADNPKGIKVQLIGGRTIDALSKFAYMSVLNGVPLTKLVENRDDAKAITDAAVFYHATRMLGNDVMGALTSPMGDIKDHEGVIIRNKNFGSKPVKITGEFIVKGLETSFPRGSLSEALKSASGKDILAVYPGRFQPMGRHHAEVFKKIQDKYGVENSFIATSDVVKAPKSPFNFAEKQMIAMGHGIDPARMIRVKNPYYSRELTDNFNPETTVIVYLVGAKDMAENPRFTKTEGTTKEGFDWAIDVAPHVSIDIPGVGEMSGTSLRKSLADASPEMFEKIMGISDSEVYNLIKAKLSGIQEQKKTFSLLYSLVEEVLEEKKKKTNCFEKGKYKTFDGKSKCIQRTKGLGKERADAYVASVLRDMGELDEASSMAGGNVHGAPAAIGSLRNRKKNKRDEDELVSEVLNYLLNMYHNGDKQ